MEDTEKQSLSLLWYKSAAISCVACLGSMGVGAILIYATFAINDLTSLNIKSPFVIHDSNQFSTWFVCLPFIGAIPGGIIGSLIKDNYGRKCTVIVGGTICSIAWLIIINAKALWMLYMGSIFNGSGGMLVLGSNILYVSEIAPPNIRGLLISFIELGISLGMLIVNICSIYLHWNYVAIVSMAFVTSNSLIFIYFYDTPRWLIYKSRPKDAQSALKWLYGEMTPEIIQRIMEQLNANVEEYKQPLPWRSLLRKPYQKPFLIIMFLFFLETFCGFYSIRAFLLQVIESLGLKMSSQVASLMYSSIALVGSIACTVAIDRGGRRMFLLTSTVITAVSILALALNLQLQGAYPSDKISWLAIIGLFGSTIGYSLGLGPIPSILMTEMFPTKARAKVTVVAITTFFVCLVVNTILMGQLSIVIGQAFMLWVGTAVSAIGIAVIYVYVPETKGKSLEETAVST